MKETYDGAKWMQEYTVEAPVEPKDPIIERLDRIIALLEKGTHTTINDTINVSDGKSSTDIANRVIAILNNKTAVRR